MMPLYNLHKSAHLFMTIFFLVIKNAGTPYWTPLHNRPIFSTSTTTSSPDLIGQLPDGEPVAKMSPGSRVITCESQLIKYGMLRDISLVFPSWTTRPFKVVTIRKLVGSTPVTMHGPKGPNVSNPLPRVNCGSFL